MKREFWHNKIYTSEFYKGSLTVGFLTYIVNGRVSFVFKEIENNGQSLASCIRPFLSEFMSQGMGATPNTDMDWYLWCEDEGLFKLNVGIFDSSISYKQYGKVLVDCVEFDKVSDSLEAFETLYGPGV